MEAVVASVAVEVVLVVVEAAVTANGVTVRLEVWVRVVVESVVGGLVVAVWLAVRVALVAVGWVTETVVGETVWELPPRQLVFSATV